MFVLDIPPAATATLSTAEAVAQELRALAEALCASHRTGFSISPMKLEELANRLSPKE